MIRHNVKSCSKYSKIFKVSLTILDNYALKYYAKIRVLKNLMKARKLNMTMINGHVDITVGISFCLNDFVLMILLCLVFVLNFIKE